MKHLILLGLVLTLAACGGRSQQDRPDRRVIQAAPTSFGPISKACLQSNRERKSVQLCSCIQAAADQTLSRSDQRKSVAFYENPHLAQQIRTSDRAQDQRFWEAYSAYGERAERLCG